MASYTRIASIADALFVALYRLICSDIDALMDATYSAASHMCEVFNSIEKGTSDLDEG